MKKVFLVLLVYTAFFFLLFSLIQISERSKLICEAKGGVELRTLDGTVCARVELIK